MNSSELYLLIQDVKNHSSRLDKEALLSKYKDDNWFRNIMNLGLNPFINYGVNKTITLPDFVGQHNFSGETLNLFIQLNDRTLTGNKAREEINTHLKSLNKDSQKLFLLILNKDFKAGFSETTINKIMKDENFIPQFKCMLAAPMKETKLKPYVIIEPKFDGVRLLAYIQEDKISFFSRGGKEFHNFDFLKHEILAIIGTNHKNLILDGELTSRTFNQIVSEVHTKDTQIKDAVYNVFDIPSVNYDQKQRKIKLYELFGENNSDTIRVVPWVLISSKKIQEHYQIYLTEGFEGAIVKDPDANYVNKRDPSWMKLKEINEMDVKIISLFEGTGKYSGMMGGMDCSGENGMTVSVGTGFSDEQRQEFWNSREELNGRMVEIKFQNATVKNSVRHPRFVRFRDSLTGIKE